MENQRHRDPSSHAELKPRLSCQNTHVFSRYSFVIVISASYSSHRHLQRTIFDYDFPFVIPYLRVSVVFVCKDFFCFINTFILENEVPNSRCPYMNSMFH